MNGKIILLVGDNPIDFQHFVEAVRVKGQYWLQINENPLLLPAFGIG